MLEELVKRLSTFESPRGCPSETHLGSFASWLLDLGYAESTVEAKLRLAAGLIRWLVQKQIRITDLDERVVDLFIDARGRLRRLHRGERPAACQFLECLREQAVIAAAAVDVEHSPITQLERCYEHHLRVERGLAGATVDNYRPFVRRFMVERFGDGPLGLNDLSASEISGFVVRHARSMSPRRAQVMASALRSFFRFLLQQGEIERDLAVLVPTVADWRLSTVPKYLKQEEVERLLQTCDRSSSTGRRDHAILLLLARLGLRAGEVTALKLDDLDWRAGEIMIRGKGLVHRYLPLLADVGEALALYLRQDRPAGASRKVFLRMRAPRRGLAVSTVSTIVRRALERSGLEAPSQGAHLLRHSLATSLLRQGASLIEIGEVLRHRLASTTEIYARLDLDRLRSVAQPWPTRGGQS